MHSENFGSTRGVAVGFSRVQVIIVVLKSGFVPFVTIVLLGWALCCAWAQQPAPPAGGKPPAPVGQSAAAELLPESPNPGDYPHLHNLLRTSERIYSGGEPGEDRAFSELAALGIKTIVSVDGARPNVEAARRHGLRYVHIPFGYDGIPAEAGLALAQVAREAEGPIYVHCHHGTHRGPAGAAVACIAAGAATGDEALAILKQAGTSREYAGLWRDVAAYTPPSPTEKLPELVEVAEVGSLAAAMAAIDRASDNLKLSQQVDWRVPPDHPDIAPRQQALLLKEGFRETVRQLSEDNPYGEELLTWMREAEQASEELEAAFTAGTAKAIDTQFKNVQGQCKRCHAVYRN